MSSAVQKTSGPVGVFCAYGHGINCSARLTVYVDVLQCRGWKVNDHLGTAGEIARCSAVCLWAPTCDNKYVDSA